jgi:hypothetical protein
LVGVHTRRAAFVHVVNLHAFSAFFLVSAHARALTCTRERAERDVCNARHRVVRVTRARRHPTSRAPSRRDAFVDAFGRAGVTAHARNVGRVVGKVF